MLPFLVDIRPGEPASAQVVHAATRAIVSGEMTAGQSFPSVRELSQALKINPNTAHKIVAELVREGLLEVKPGVGTVVAAVIANLTNAQLAAMKDAIELLIVEARRSGMNRTDLLELVSDQWKSLFGSTSTRKSKRTNDE